MGIGHRIKEAREKLGMTQMELAKKIGVTGSAITNYENNVSHPKEPILYKLLNILEVDANFLFQDEMTETNTKNQIFLTVHQRKVIEKYMSQPEIIQKAIDRLLDIRDDE